MKVASGMLARKGRWGAKVAAALVALVLAMLLAPSSAFSLDNDEPEVTRAEWIHDLIATFDVTVEDESYPEEYFADITVESPYYEDLVKAVEFGIIDVPAGGEVRPDDAATRDFAVHTLNYCLGYQLLEDAEYSFSDPDACMYPKDAQVAIDHGWFQLVDGAFQPELPVTEAERATCMEIALEVWQSTSIDEGHENVVEVAEGVKEIPEGTVIEEPEADVFAITNCPVEIAEGDTFVAYFYGMPNAFTADSVTVDGEVTTIVTSKPQVDDVSELFDEIDYQGVTDLGQGTYVPPSDSELEGNSSDPQLFAQAGPDHTFTSSFEDGTFEAEYSAKLEDQGTEDASSSMKISISVDNMQLENRCTKDSATVILHGEATVKGEFEGAWERTINLGTVRILGAGKVALDCEFGVSGGGSASYTSLFSTGFQVTKDDVRLVHNFHKKSFNLVTKAALDLALKVQMGIDVVAAKGDIYFEIGPTAEVKTDYDPTVTPHSCMTISAHLAASTGAEAEINLILFKRKFALSHAVFDENNSPVKLAFHYEDGLLVDKCTREYPVGYVTDPNSKTANAYAGAGPIDSLDDDLLVGDVYSIDEETTLTGNKYYAGNLLINANVHLNGYKLTVSGNVVHSKGTVYVEKGRFRVKGDYKLNGSPYTSNPGTLDMSDPADLVDVRGSLTTLTMTAQSGNLAAGTLRVGGSIVQQHGGDGYIDWSLKTGEGLTVVLDGASRQEVSGGVTFSRLVVENPEGLTCSGSLYVGELSCGRGLSVIVDRGLSFGAKSTGGSPLSFEGNVSFDSDTSTDGGDVSVAGNASVSAALSLGGGSMSVTGDVTQSSGTVDLGGGTLSVGGNYSQSAGTVVPGGGSLLVSGDYTITGSPSFSNPGTLDMSDPADLVDVRGSLTTRTMTLGALAAGTLRVGGSIVQQHGGDGYIDWSFKAGEGLTVVLDGASRQEVSGDVTFSRLVVENPEGLTWTGAVRVTQPLSSDLSVVAPKGLGVYQLSLGGHSLTVEGGVSVQGALSLGGGSMSVTGDVTHSSGAVDLGGGTLSVGGGYSQTGGSVTLGGGSLLVPGDYSIRGEYAALKMADPADLVDVGGSFTVHTTAAQLSAGTVRVGGSFVQTDPSSGYGDWSLKTGERLTVVLDGSSRQEVSLKSSSSRLSRLVVENPEGLSCSGCLHVGELSCDRALSVLADGGLGFGVSSTGGASLSFEGNVSFYRDTSLGGSDVSVAGNASVSAALSLGGGSMSVTGDVTHSSGAVDLGGGTLSVGGGYSQTGGSVTLGGGSLLVPGDYSIRGEYAALKMADPADLVDVGGSFTVHTTAAQLSAGTVRVGGSFVQTDPSSGYGDWSLKTGERLTVVLDGSSRQEVSLKSSGCTFSRLVVENPEGLTWTGAVRVTQPLSSDLSVVAPKGLGVYQLSLGGHSLTVEGGVSVQGALSLGGGSMSVTGDVTHSSGAVDLGGGTLSVGGDYAMTGNSSLKMLAGTDTVSVGGSLTFASSTYHGSSLLNDGKLVVGGDFTDNSSGNFVPSGNHLTVLNGSEPQTVKFSKQASRFNILQLMQPYENYSFSYTDCWKELISSGDVDPSDTVHVTGITLDKKSIELSAMGDELTLVATVEPADASDPSVTWSSSDESVATVSSDGVVKAVSEGSATITAKTADGGLTATCVVKVTALREGWYTFADGAKGYAKDGKLVKGWMDLDGGKYWFDDQGRMATGWTDLVVGGKAMHYYFRPSGNLARGAWADIDGKKYWFRASGNMATGWADIDGRKYWFDGSGQMVTGWRDIVNDNGATNHYYFRPSGSMATGWAEIDGEHFYFRPSGNMATGFTDVTDDAYKRYFDESGRMLTGWQKINGNTYYFRASGAMQTGEATIDGKAYTFSDKGVLVSGAAPAMLSAPARAEAAPDPDDGAVADAAVAETEAEAMAEPEAVTEPEAEADTESVAELEARVEDEPAAEPQPEGEAEAEPDPVASGECGTCAWSLDAEGVLVIGPADGEPEGTLAEAPVTSVEPGDVPEAPADGTDPAEAYGWLAPEVAPLVREVRVLEGVRAPRSLAGAFAGLDKLEVADLSGLDVSGAEDLSRLLDGCASLRELDLSGWDLSSLEDSESFAGGCGALERVVAPEGLDVVTLGIDPEITSVSEP